MALMNCPECGGTVSTLAAACPHCGYPVNGLNEVRQDDYTKIIYRGIILDITSVLEMLRSGDAYMAQLEMSDIYENTQIVHEDTTTTAMLKKVVKNYEKVYGQPPAKLPPCLTQKEEWPE